jgi:hypothetical protein
MKLLEIAEVFRRWGLLGGLYYWVFYVYCRCRNWILFKVVWRIRPPKPKDIEFKPLK